MAVSKYGLIQSKGAFQICGIVTGTQSDNYYREGTGKTGQPYRILNFGVEYEPGKVLYMNLMGSPREFVYFSKNGGKNGTTETKKVAWGNRHSFNEDGFNLIGVRLGVTQSDDGTGKLVNNRTIMTEFDACKEIHNNLADGQSVYIYGNIDYRSYYDNSGQKKQVVNLVPTQISLCKPINFDAENFWPRHSFKQQLVFMGLSKEKNEENKATGRAIVSSKIVTYQGIEDMDFVVENPTLINTLKKTLKPYNAIEVEGQIVRQIETEVIADDDDIWGSPSEFTKITAPSKVEYLITRGNKETVDTEVYSKESIEDALAQIAKDNQVSADFGDDSDDWDLDGMDDDLPWGKD